MITPQFMAGLKDGMMTIRTCTYSVEDAASGSDLVKVAGEMAKLVGHALHCQSVLTAKIVYEASIKEQEEYNAKAE